MTEPQKMYDSEKKWENWMGAMVEGMNLTPRSDAISKMERIITGVGPTLWDDPAGYEQELFGALTTTTPEMPDRMPSNILAMMKLAETFPLVEGDVYQAMICPIDLGLTNIDPSCKDKGLENEVIDLYDRLDMQELADINWLYTQTYGQGFPLENWEKNDLVAVLYPNPKHVHIGSAFGFGPRSMGLESDVKLRERLLKETNPPMWVDVQGPAWNEYKAMGTGTLPLKADVVTHLHVRKLPHNRYAIPPIARAYRTISTRQVLESMIRATIEGISTQLWLYRKIQGEKFMRGEVAALEDKLQASRGDTIRHFVWPDLEIEQYIPKAIDQLLANDKWLALTYHIFRQLGINIYVVSGERASQVRGDPLVDIKVFMARIEQDKRRQIRWVQSVTDKWTQKQGKAAKENPVKVRFKMSAFDAEAMIRDRLMPLMTLGLLDIQTALEEANYDYDVITTRKKEQEPIRYLYMPQASFAQVGPGSREQPGRVVESDSSRGRTPDSQNPNALLKASIEDYGYAISRSFEDVKKAEDDDKKRAAIAAFIATLMLTNRTQMTDAYRRGYFDAGGRQEPMPDRIEATVAWNNDYARNFEKDMLAAVEAGEDLGQFEDRAGMYSPQGFKKAFMAGVFQSKRYEQGYTGWRRMLHPELSKSGPCSWCIADSQIIHPIEEEFTDHPLGVCTVSAFLSFYRGGASSYPMRVPELTTRPTMGTIPR